MLYKRELLISTAPCYGIRHSDSIILMRQWYCARTHYNQEFEARKHIERSGHAVFLPSYLVKSGSGNIRTKLLFRNYIFFSLDDPMLWPRIRNTFGIADVLLYSPEEDKDGDIPWYQMPSAIGSAAIETLRALALTYDQIRRKAGEVIPTRPLQIITAGCHVRILRGPLTEFSIQRPIVEWADDKRALLPFMLFGREFKAEFYLRDLELDEIPDAAR